MSYRDGVAYPPNHEFPPAALAAITPEEIVRWMKYRVYQDPDADHDIDKPTLRSKPVLYWKKSISFFVPNKRMEWNELSNVGNPTKSEAVNELIRAIKRMEAARLLSLTYSMIGCIFSVCSSFLCLLALSKYFQS